MTHAPLSVSPAPHPLLLVLVSAPRPTISLLNYSSHKFTIQDPAPTPMLEIPLRYVFSLAPGIPTRCPRYVLGDVSPNHDSELSEHRRLDKGPRDKVSRCHGLAHHDSAASSMASFAQKLLSTFKMVFWSTCFDEWNF